VTDEQPDTVSFGSQRPPVVAPRWARRVRGSRRVRGYAILAVAVVLGGLGTVAGLLIAHQNDTINHLRTALAQARSSASASASAGADTALPVESDSALFTVPDVTGGSLYVVATADPPRPGSAPLTWLYIYDQHAKPGARYGLLVGVCDGQHVAPADLADGTANQVGDLTIVAPNLDLDARAGNVWILVVQWQDGLTLGGVQGPLIGTGARFLRSAPPC
jgi:hypothetical protein